MKNYKPCPLAGWLSLGIIRGLWVVVLGIMWFYREQYANLVNNLGNFYVWYSLSFGGLLLWFLWAFLDAFLWGVVIIWLYNVIYKLIKKQ